MKIIKIFTQEDNKSYFVEMDSGPTTKEKLGNYSQKYPVAGMIFRDFDKGQEFAWHNAPDLRYIFYLEGEVEVEASGGEKRIFKPGDILFVTDLTGEGHISRTLTKGRSIIVTLK